MIKLENYEVVGWEHAIRGMRNPMNSWDKSDTGWVPDSLKDDRPFIKYDSEWMKKKVIGPNDHELMMKLANGGPVHAKYRRMIVVYVDITAPLYWWKEFDTYKVGTVANSCSTMHKIHEKPLTLDDFSHEHLYYESMCALRKTIVTLNAFRDSFLLDKSKDDWWQMIQLLPSSYNQRRTVKMNYEVLVGIYRDRKNHKLDEWREFCQWIEKLPYSELITSYRKPDFTNHDTSFDYD